MCSTAASGNPVPQARPDFETRRVRVSGPVLHVLARRRQTHGRAAWLPYVLGPAAPNGWFVPPGSRTFLARRRQMDGSRRLAPVRSWPGGASRTRSPPDHAGNLAVDGTAGTSLARAPSSTVYGGSLRSSTCRGRTFGKCRRSGVAISVMLSRSAMAITEASVGSERVVVVRVDQVDDAIHVLWYELAEGEVALGDRL